MYIHSGSLVEAIQDKPANPFASAYAHSVAAAYIAASSVVEANKRNFAAHPSLFTRWYDSIAFADEVLSTGTS
jgi:hypothetical protein